MSFDRLIENIVKTQNPSVVGLDPKLEYIPAYIVGKKVKKYGKTLKAAAKAILEFNKGIIDEIHDICPAIKPQAAYYEMYGWEGVKTLCKTIEYAQQKGMFVITDGKRNDIGATMDAYAAAHLGFTDVCGEQTLSPSTGILEPTVSPPCLKNAELTTRESSFWSKPQTSHRASFRI